ncbi:hypothetical protein [Cohnella rhizosphaerae]|uniref:Uncharacterized protein n=1 Tax=Cohnella rhizosphaerae TaxID=1457232 RepID=A0A9X4L056_9BACL|nr:hypothetical protein [Cohnella rhizosphaerae]MDG0814504.1 hypothetical protein [Cohnella rhizosphaerae]
MSLILFCEYSIPETNRERFLAWALGEPSRWKGAELAENREQPGVFVELRRPANDSEAAAMKKERLEGRSWSEMTSWVKGGREGLRVWTFAPLAPVAGTAPVNGE